MVHSVNTEKLTITCNCSCSLKSVGTGTPVPDTHILRTNNLFNKGVMQDLVVRAFNPSTRDAEAEGSLDLKAGLVYIEYQDSQSCIACLKKTKKARQTNKDLGVGGVHRPLPSLRVSGGK